MTNIQPPMEHFERPDPVLTNKIVTHLKSQGIFDQFRRECMADVDTKPAYHNLRQRVEGSVAAFLRMNPWRPDMNKNQLRDNLRKHIQSGGFLDIGVDRIVDQVVNPKIYTVFLPKVEEVVQTCLGMENDKPKFEPPPPTEVKSEPPKFQDKHNLAPRAKLPAPLMGPTVTPLKPQGRSSPTGEKLVDGGDTDTEEAGDKKYVVDEDDLEEKEEDEDDEESPPFEPHSEGDRLILGMRSDSSENSNDSQVVTTIVDDSLEERIDNNEEAVKEESDKKDEDSSSDEYVPKTPTINMEESDGTVLEFNSISEYKQYQSKFEEESLGNIEEVVESQCTTDNNELVKEERSSNEEDFISGAQKRKFNSDSYDDVSSSSSDRESTSDEIKPAVFESFTKKRLKLEEYDHDHDNETSELSINDADVEDYYIEKSSDITDSKLKILSNEHTEKPKDDGSKDSGKNCKEHRESSSYHSSKERTTEKEHHEKSQNSHSSKEKKDVHKKSEKHESSSDQNKERDRKRSQSSSKHNEKDGKSKHYEKEKEKDKKRSKSSERSKKDKEDVDKNRKESKHDHKDHHHEGKSRADHDKEKKKHTSHDRHSDGKGGHDSAHKSDKDRRDGSKHSHSSSRHSHRSSSEKHKSDKDHKHRGSSDRHKSHDKKLDKETKDESKKRYREHCKYNTDKDENRRSSDRDSSGPSDRTHISSSSKSKSSRTLRETKIETSGKTTSNSDNTVSDNIEPLDDVSKSYAVSEHGKTSPDLQLEDSQNDWNGSKEELDQPENMTKHSYKQTEVREVKYRDDIEDNYETRDTSDFQTQALISENDIDPESNVFSPGNAEEVYCETKQDSTSPSALLHDSSSEKENVEQDIKEQSTPELDGSSTDASIDEDSTVVKFKKPKIAKNIHEVKKIMEARRHLKRMEKKRIKLLLKSNSEEYESDEKSPVEIKSENESQCDSFKGFKDDLSPEKVKKYECLTLRLENEASQLEKLINFEQLNTNLITSWVDLDPDFDNYIENTLKGKVHRKYRIHLPPICDEYYTYDSEQNVYFLVQDWDATEQKDVLVDGNLNNLSNQQENKALYSEKSRKRKLREEPISCDNRETLYKGCVFPKQSSLKHKQNQRNSQSDDEVVTITDDNDTSSNSDSRKAASNVIESQIVLTFNQTYDEVLKEKAQNSFVSCKREVEEKAPFTVVKITNNQTSEQVFMKKIQSNSEEVPRITRSETILNGKITEKASDSKQVPLISRITKAKIASVPSTMRNNRKKTNGILTSDSTINSKYEENYPVGVSQKIINDVIGIQYVSSDQGNISDQSNQSREEVSDRKRMRMTGCRQQRYDSSDLYKPRPQLTSRRVRAVGSSPEEPAAPLVVSRRKRSAASESNSTRRR